MTLQLNINNGEWIFPIEPTDSGPRYSKDQEAYEQFWEYHHPSTNDVFVDAKHQQQYEDLNDADLIEEQWYEEVA